MNKKKLILSVVVILVVSCLFAMANNFHWFGKNNDSRGDLPGAKEELQKIYAKYNDPSASLNVTGTIRLYDKENDDQLKEQMPFSYSRHGMQFYMRMGSLQTFFADSLLIQLDTANKYIILSKIDAASLPVPVPGALPFERFMNDTSSFRIDVTVSEKNRERALTIKSDLSPEIKTSVIYYDPVSYAVKRTEIEWWKEAVAYDSDEDRKKIWLTVVEYNYGGAPSMPVSERIKNIIVETNGKIEPAPAFSDYQVQSSF